MRWKEVAIIIGVVVVFLSSLPWATLTRWAKEEAKSRKEIV
jgi:hypothetical protein